MGYTQEIECSWGMTQENQQQHPASHWWARRLKMEGNNIISVPLDNSCYSSEHNVEAVLIQSHSGEIMWCWRERWIDWNLLFVRVVLQDNPLYIFLKCKTDLKAIWKDINLKQHEWFFYVEVAFIVFSTGCLKCNFPFDLYCILIIRSVMQIFPLAFMNPCQ